MALRQMGQFWIGGSGRSTRSSDFPTTAGAFNTGLNAVLDAWIALLVSVGAADVEEPPMAGITPASLRLARRTRTRAAERLSLRSTFRNGLA